MKNVGVTDPDTIKSISDFWLERFFTNIYLMTDAILAGGPEFVNACYDRGATIVYLTGRDVPRMEIGSRESLLRDGFPINKPRTKLMMKPHYKEKDLARIVKGYQQHIEKKANFASLLLLTTEKDYFRLQGSGWLNRYDNYPFFYLSIKFGLAV